MSLDPHSGPGPEHLARTRDPRWTLGFNRTECFAEPTAQASRRHRFAARSTVFNEGDDAHAVYLIIEGGALMYRIMPDGRRQIIELLGPGDVFGMTTSGRHDACVEALGPTRVTSYDQRTLDDYCVVQQLFTERMQAKICQLHDHAVLLGRKSAMERVATFLLLLVSGRAATDHVDRGDAGAARFDMVLTRQEIADYLGLTPETVSRAFSQLRRDGIVAYDRSEEITIAQIGRLRRASGDAGHA